VVERKILIPAPHLPCSRRRYHDVRRLPPSAFVFSPRVALLNYRYLLPCAELVRTAVIACLAVPAALPTMVYLPLGRILPFARRVSLLRELFAHVQFRYARACWRRCFNDLLLVCGLTNVYPHITRLLRDNGVALPYLEGCRHNRFITVWVGLVDALPYALPDDDNGLTLTLLRLRLTLQYDDTRILTRCRRRLHAVPYG